jgi:pyrroloquinoline quinone biosynthesis protein D
MDGTRVPRLRRHVRLRHDPARDAWVLVVPEGVVTLNATAAEVLQRCDGRSLQDLVSGLRREYPSAPEESLRTDVTEVLERLVARGHLQWEVE